MHEKLLALIAALAILAPGAARAQSAQDQLKGLYFELRGGGVLLDDADNSGPGLTGDIVVESGFDTGYVVDGAIGYAHASGLRGEIALGYRSNDIDSLTIADDGGLGGLLDLGSLNGLSTSAVSGDARMISLMANGYYDFDLGGGLRPFLGAGVGAVFILRWFWWRINVWSEIAAMVGSVVIFTVFKVFVPEEQLRAEYRSLIVASCTLVVWLVVTFLTKPEPDDHLVAFYRKVRPDGPGWRPIADLAPDARPDGLLGRGLLCTVLGTAVIWLTLPGIGGVIFGQTMTAVLCLGGAAVCGALMFFVFGSAPAP